MVARWWLLGFLLVGTQHCLLASQHHSYQGLLSSLRFFFVIARHMLFFFGYLSSRFPVSPITFIFSSFLSFYISPILTM